jgi:hypothetical protein
VKMNGWNSSQQKNAAQKASAVGTESPNHSCQMVYF